MLFKILGFIVGAVADELHRTGKLRVILSQLGADPRALPFGLTISPYMAPEVYTFALRELRRAEPKTPAEAYEILKKYALTVNADGVIVPDGPIAAEPSACPNCGGDHLYGPTNCATAKSADKEVNRG